MAYGKIKISGKFADDADYTENVVSSYFPEITYSSTKRLLASSSFASGGSRTIFAVNQFDDYNCILIRNAGTTNYAKISWTSPVVGGDVDTGTGLTNSLWLAPGQQAILPNVEAGISVTCNIYSPSVVGSAGATTEIYSFVLAT